jgi:hypothetical protein
MEFLKMVLRQNFLFSALTDDEIAAFCLAMQREVVDIGQVICNKGDPGNGGNAKLISVKSDLYVIAHRNIFRIRWLLFVKLAFRRLLLYCRERQGRLCGRRRNRRELLQRRLVRGTRTLVSSLRIP